MPDFIIETNELTRCYNQHMAVDHLNLKINKSEIFGLLGPNGAGKSTTIKMLITLLPPSSGTGMIAGFDIVKQARQVRRRIGYVPQAVSADGTLTVRENLKLSAKLYGLHSTACKVAIQEALQFMELEPFAGKLVRDLSGGTIRRLEIAQALMHKPEVLFLDEPTIGLDPTARHAVWNRLKALKSQYRTTVLLTTHDMDEADHLCDRLAILHQGVIVVLGSPRELKAQVGLHASLDDVFIHYSGIQFQEGDTHNHGKTSQS